MASSSEDTYEICVFRTRTVNRVDAYDYRIGDFSEVNPYPNLKDLALALRKELDTGVRKGTDRLAISIDFVPFHSVEWVPDEADPILCFPLTSREIHVFWEFFRHSSKKRR